MREEGDGGEGRRWREKDDGDGDGDGEGGVMGCTPRLPPSPYPSYRCTPWRSWPNASSAPVLRPLSPCPPWSDALTSPSSFASRTAARG